MQIKKFYTLGVALLSFGSIFAQNAMVQIIHNAPDPDLKTVDIYLDNTKVQDDMNFRTATAFTSVSSGIHVFSIAPSNSSSVLNAIVTKSVTLTAGESYTVIADGVKTPANFEKNPDGTSTSAELILIAGTMKKPLNPKGIRVSYHQGISDLGNLGFMIRDKGIAYADYKTNTKFRENYEGPAILDVVNGKSTGQTYASYVMPTGFFDTSYLVLGSGFYDSSKNQKVNSMKFYVVFADGSLRMLKDTTLPLARIQFINTSADPKLSKIDLYYDSTKIYDDLEYGKATGFLELKNDSRKVSFAPSNSTSISDTFYSQEIYLKNLGYNIGMIYGLSDPSKFASNPNSLSTKLNVNLRTSWRPFSNDKNTTDIVFFNAITDANKLELGIKSTNQINDTIVTDDVTYGAYGAKYFTIDNYINNYRITLREQKTNGFAMSYTTSFAQQQDSTVVLVASGFVDPSSNGNGKAISFWKVSPSGKVEMLSTTTAINENSKSDSKNISIFPNPANNIVNLNLTNKISYVKIQSLDGKTVYSVENPSLGTLSIPASQFPKGMYLISTNLGTSNNKLIIQ